MKNEKYKGEVEKRGTEISMRLWISALAGLLCLSLSGCGTIIAKNIKATSESWDVKIIKIKDGPNSVNAPFVYLFPKRGYRFIWLTVEIKNNEGAGQVIDLKEIMLIYDQTIMPPFYFLFDVWLYVPSSSEITINPGKSIRRRMLYSIPIGKRPQLVRVPKVGDISIDVIQAKMTPSLVGS